MPNERIPHATEALFERYLRLDAEELAAAAEAAQDELERLEAIADSPRRAGARVDAEALNAAFIENGAAAFAEAIQRAQTASSGDYGALALQGALYGIPATFDQLLSRCQKEPLERLHGIIEGVEVWRRRFGEVGQATFRAGTLELASLVANADGAIASVEAMLRAERARRLSAADGAAEGKSERNRARRAKEQLALIPEVREEYANAALTVASHPWIAERMGYGAENAVPVLARKGVVPKEFTARAYERALAQAAEPEEVEALMEGMADIDAGGIQADEKEDVKEVLVEQRSEAPAAIPSQVDDARETAANEAKDETAARDALIGTGASPAPGAGRSAEDGGAKDGETVAAAEQEPLRAGERRFARMRFSADAVHPYETKPNDKGEVFSKAVVNLPDGTAIDGRSLDGYSADTFLRDFHKEALAMGEPVVLGWPADQPVRLFAKGKPAVEADPWKLASAVKAARENAVAPAASEREAQRVAVKVPASWAVGTFTTKPNAEGKRFDMVRIAMPAGMEVAGQALDGFTFATFLRDFHKEALADGRDLVFRFDETEPVRLTDKEGTVIEANPWSLTCAVKAAREGFAKEAATSGKSADAAREVARAIAKGDAAPVAAKSVSL